MAKKHEKDKEIIRALSHVIGKLAENPPLGLSVLFLVLSGIKQAGLMPRLEPELDNLSGVLLVAIPISAAVPIYRAITLTRET